MSKGTKITLLVLVLAAVIVAAVLASKPKGPQVVVPESGPVLVEEQIPTDPSEKVAFDVRKAASACRVAIMQSAKDPASISFSHEIDQTPSVAEDNGDYSFKIVLKAQSESGVVPRQINCRAHQEETGWSIADLQEAPRVE